MYITIANIYNSVPESKLRTLFKRILLGKYPTWIDLNSIYCVGL